MYKANIAIIGINDRVSKRVARLVAKRLNLRFFDLEAYRDYILQGSTEEAIKKTSIEYCEEQAMECVSGLKQYNKTVMYMDRALLLDQAKNVIKAIRNCYLVVITGSFTSFAAAAWTREDFNTKWSQHLYNKKEELYSTLQMLESFADLKIEKTHKLLTKTIIDTIKEKNYEV